MSISSYDSYTYISVWFQKNSLFTAKGGFSCRSGQAGTPSQKVQKSLAETLKCCSTAMFHSDNSSVKARRVTLTHPQEFVTSRLAQRDGFSPKQEQVDNTPRSKAARRTSIGTFIQKIKQTPVSTSTIYN